MYKAPLYVTSVVKAEYRRAEDYTTNVAKYDRKLKNRRIL